jgi:gamma-glutamylcyclotransferase (GGCT)/AIG2-like uncharacterized protein YtfP
MSIPINHIFVYGTLKQGECRGDRWPCKPQSITSAFVRGELYDLGPYPALLPPAAGTLGDRIGGEVWEFDSAAMPKVLRVLDQIEGYDQPGESNLYERVVIECQTTAGDIGKAFTYYYVKSAASLDPSTRVQPDLVNICHWHGD